MTRTFQHIHTPSREALRKESFKVSYGYMEKYYIASNQINEQTEFSLHYLEPSVIANKVKQSCILEARSGVS